MSADAVCRYARGLRILLRGLPLAERLAILKKLEAGISEEEACEALRLLPRKFQVVDEFLKLVKELQIRETDIREQSCAEVRSDLADLEEAINREVEQRLTR